MHLASWSVAALVTVSALLLGQSTQAAGKEDKLEPRTGSLEDELESSLPQPQLEEQLKTVKSAPQSPPKQLQPAAQQQEQQRKQPQAEQPRGEGHRPSREELREMFHELLESMTEAERKSLTLRLGRESVKRTFSRLRDELRTQPVATGSVSKRALPPREAAGHHAKALRMRRSLLLGAMESGMSAARQRRRKRDLGDYSPEEYARLAALLAADRVGYVEDSDGNIRLERDDDDEGEGNEDGGEEKRRAGDSHGAVADSVEERGGAGEADGDDHDNDDKDDIVDDDDHPSEKDDLAEDGDNGRASLAVAPPPPPPPPPPPLPVLPRERQPLTMFMVRMAGEKGLFVPLNQERAQQLAVELAGEAAVAEAAEAQASAEAVAEAAAEAAAERLRHEEGVAELKRFAEQLARRVPPGY